MICDLCKKNEATIFIEQSSINGTKKIALCVECAKLKGYSENSKQISSDFNLFLDSVFGRSDKNLVCPVCGTSLNKILQFFCAGCPECYNIFKNEITDLLKKKQVYGEYKGSMPKRISSYKSVLQDRIEIKKKLEIAIKDEDYEKAAFYRDYLNAIDSKPVLDGEN